MLQVLSSYFHTVANVVEIGPPPLIVTGAPDVHSYGGRRSYRTNNIITHSAD